MSTPFDIMTPAKAGFLGLFADRNSEKKLRGERMTGAAEVRDEKNKGHGNFRARNATDPANTLLLMSDLSKNAPRGSVGSWTFAAPVTKEGGKWRPLAAWGKPNKDDFAPFAAKRLGPNDAIAVETTGHADHETVVLTGASLDIIAHHRGPDLHTRSTDVHDIDANGDVSDIVKGGLHAPLKVMGWPLAFCKGLPDPDPTGKKTAAPGQVPPSRYFPLLNFTKSEKDNSGNGAATFAERETVFSYETFGGLRPSDDDHLIGLVNIGGVIRKVSEGAFDIYKHRWGSEGTLFSPMRFFNVPWQRGATGRFYKQVIFSEDFGATHAGLCGPHRGQKDWYTFSDWTELPKCKPTRTYVNAAGDTVSTPTDTPSRYYPDQPTIYTPDETQNPSHRDQPRPCVLEGPPGEIPPGITVPPKKNPPTAPPSPPGTPPPESPCGEVVRDRKTQTKADFGYTTAQALAMPVVSHILSLPEYLVSAAVTGPEDPNERCPTQKTFPAAMAFEPGGDIKMLHPATGNGTKIFAPAEIEDYHCLTNYKGRLPARHSDLTVMMLSGKGTARDGTDVTIDTRFGWGWRAPLTARIASGFEARLDFNGAGGASDPDLVFEPKDASGDYDPASQARMIVNSVLQAFGDAKVPLFANPNSGDYADSTYWARDNGDSTYTAMFGEQELGGGGATPPAEVTISVTGGAPLPMATVADRDLGLLYLTADETVTGIDEPDDNTAVMDVWLYNGTAYSLTINDHSDGISNVVTSLGASYVLGPEQSVLARWSPNLSLWVLL